MNHPTSGKEEKVKYLSGEEKWNRIPSKSGVWAMACRLALLGISFLLYTTCVILAVLSLYFTSGPTPEDVALGGKFMLVLVALVFAYFAFGAWLRRE